MNDSPGRLRTGILLFLFFLSGAAALIYEVLWLKDLGRLFGVTAYAAATILAVFFLGLAAGSNVWGRRAARIAKPLKTYALLELGIAFTALLYFFLLDLYRWLYSPLVAAIGHRPGVLLLIKFLLATGILFLPAFFMGGTLPVMGQYLVRRADQLGKTATLLYAVNTVGAAAGALAAGFFLPPTLGFRGSYLVAMALNLIVAAVAWWWSRSAIPPAATAREAPPERRRRPSPSVGGAGAEIPPRILGSVAFFSGFLTLGLEVLWTRMFAQILQNSVYTFAAILTVFLASLALGSVLAHILCRIRWSPPTVLYGLLTASGLLVGLTPLGFYHLSSGLEVLYTESGWTSYIVAAFTTIAAVLLIPGMTIGSVFPFLMKASEGRMTSAGRTIGQLASLNTLAAILGSLAAGFILLDLLGLWASQRLMAVGYLLLAIFALPARAGSRKLLAAVPALGILLFAFLLTYSEFAVAHLDPAEREELVAAWEGSHGTVVVINRDGDLRIKVNNSYLLGTSGSAPNLRLQSWLPLSLHPHPRSVFFLGMGTGITAGAALDHPVVAVTVSELNPHVVLAAREHFRPYLNGLFDDPRVAVAIEDGRTYLQGTRDRYDVIIADIFLTYKAGTGNLYTREHFTTVRSRLDPAGLFVQWLPFFELSQREFGTIARTMLEVFPQVTLWRRGFSPRFPLMALIGQNEVACLDNAAFKKNLQGLFAQAKMPRRLWLQGIPHAAYAGNLTAVRPLFADYPILTDDRPLIEYLSPITNRDDWEAKTAHVLAWTELADFCDRIFRELDPRDDPYLEELSGEEIGHVLAGLALYKSEVYRRTGRLREADAERAELDRLLGGSAPAQKP